MVKTTTCGGQGVHCMRVTRWRGLGAEIQPAPSFPSHVSRRGAVSATRKVYLFLTRTKAPRRLVESPSTTKFNPLSNFSQMLTLCTLFHLDYYFFNSLGRTHTSILKKSFYLNPPHNRKLQRTETRGSQMCKSILKGFVFLFSSELPKTFQNLVYREDKCTKLTMH